MTVIKGQKVEAFLEQIPQDIRAVLCYGSDAGLVCERARKTVQSFLAERTSDPFALVRLSHQDIAAESSQLLDALCAISMSPGRRCVCLRLKTSLPDGLLTRCLSRIPPDTLLVVEAENLLPTSALRKIFEKTENWVAIPCYADGQTELASLMTDMLLKAGLKIDPDAKSFLLSYLGNDRMASRAEIEKICLYALDGDGTIHLQDLKSIMADVSALEMDDMLDAVGLGDLPRFDRSVHRLLAEGISHAQIIGAAIRHFCLIHQICCAAEAGGSLRALVTGRRPPLFFKRHESIIRQCQIWNKIQLNKILDRLHEAERLSRVGDLIAQAAVVRTLLLCAVQAKAFGERKKYR